MVSFPGFAEIPLPNAPTSTGNAGTMAPTATAASTMAPTATAASTMAASQPIQQPGHTLNPASQSSRRSPSLARPAAATTTTTKPKTTSR